MTDRLDALVDQFASIERERMRSLPIVNPRLHVEPVAFTRFGEHDIGVLLTSWFMNLVLLPGTDKWDTRAVGSTTRIALPGARLEFSVCRDTTIGTYLTAVLFRSVTEFPDQETARAIAVDVMRRLAKAPDTAETPAHAVSRRQLLAGLRTA